MKNSFTTLVIFLSISVSYQLSYAQVTQEWVQRYNGLGNNNDAGQSIAVDNSGNVYVTGLSFGIGTSADFATIKYNSSGTQQWIQRYNGPSDGYDVANRVVVDGSGNVYVTGSSKGSGTNQDYATIKYNSSGTQQWLQRYNGPSDSDDVANSVAVDVSGNVYVTGRSAGSGTNQDYATVKYNSSGTQQWVQRYNGTGNNADQGLSIAVDIDGSAYVTGPSIGSGTSSDYVTIKYNTSGTQQWVQRYNGSGNGNDLAKSVVIDNLGNVYVTGLSFGIGTSADYATIKYNSSGALQWVQRYNGTGNDYDEGVSMAVDILSNVYVTGNSTGNGTFIDYATVKYDFSGIQQWVQRYNGSGNYHDAVFSLAVDDSRNVYITGYSFSTGTNSDYTTIKYNTSGLQEWIQRYNGPGTGSEVATSIAVNSSADVCVTGYSTGIGTSLDYATVKYSQQHCPNPDLSNWKSPCYNCMNYAFNDKSVFFAQIPIPVISCLTAIPYVISELNLDEVPEPPEGTPPGPCTDGNCMVALFTIPEINEFHWVRRNDDGTWTQKHGSMPAIGTDDEGAAMTDLVNPPHRATIRYRNFRYGFCGYYCIPDPGPELPEGRVWAATEDRLLSYEINKSGTEDEFIELPNISLVASKLPTLSSIPDPNWNNNGSFGGYSLIPGSAVSGFPPYLRVFDGVVAYYSDLEGTNITYYSDNHGLGTYLESQFSSTINLTVLIEGLYNNISNRMVRDTARIYLRNVSPPYLIADSSKSLLDSNGNLKYKFSNAANGVSYYIVVKHRNSIETWSSIGDSLGAHPLVYNFTDSSSRAFGNNLVLKGSRYCIYSGDVNQDGVVDATDNSAIGNDASNFVTGYVVTDLTGDEIVDASDAAVADNNAFNFVLKITP